MGFLNLFSQKLILCLPLPPSPFLTTLPSMLNRLTDSGLFRELEQQEAESHKHSGFHGNRRQLNVMPYTPRVHWLQERLWWARDWGASLYKRHIPPPLHAPQVAKGHDSYSTLAASRSVQRLDRPVWVPKLHSNRNRDKTAGAYSSPLTFV